MNWFDIKTRISFSVKQNIWCFTIYWWGKSYKNVTPEGVAKRRAQKAVQFDVKLRNDELMKTI